MPYSERYYDYLESLADRTNLNIVDLVYQLYIIKNRNRLERAHERTIEGTKKGDESVENVMDAVLDLDEIVLFAKKTVANSLQDREGIDIVTVVIGGNEVKIQVKSKKSKVKEFIKERGKLYLLENSIIAINGQNPRTVIQNAYLSGILELDKFHGRI
jgi:hypothetical protein